MESSLAAFFSISISIAVLIFQENEGFSCKQLFLGIFQEISRNESHYSRAPTSIARLMSIQNLFKNQNETKGRILHKLLEVK